MGQFYFVADHNPIREWLSSGRDYRTGVALFEVYGQDDLLLDALKQGHSPYRQGRLVTALREAMQRATRPALPEAAPKVEAVTVAAVVMPENAVKREDDPYHDKWMPLYSEMKALGHQLEDAKNDGERGEMAHRILALERQCNRWWELRAHYRKTGIMLSEPMEEGEPITDRNAIWRRITNIRTYVSKAEKLVDDPKKGPDALARIDKYNAELAKLEKLLKDA